MRPHQSFSVVPNLPKPLERMVELAGNLRFSWDPATIDLFRLMDRDLWEECESNPVLFLGRISQARLEECAQDDAILANLNRVWAEHTKYMGSDATWYSKRAQVGLDPVIAYFSAEFGMHSCMPLYSGGLGVLSGDHLKSASDLGLPLLGVGLLYQRGYFQQYLNPDGWQQEKYPLNDFHNMPLRPLHDAEGSEIVVDLPLEGRTLHIKVWRAMVGRTPLILLDTNLLSNSVQHRHITSDLYGGDSETRLLQEYVLGVGGLRALHAIGRDPTVCHMNEGHSAFLTLERIRTFMEKDKLSFEEARTASAASTVFTTHTPVRAAIDLFSSDQMDRVFRPWREHFGLSIDQLMDLGRENPGDAKGPFNMAIFALRSADLANGVAQLHGEVSRRMWKDLWPGVPENEVPISAITNGVHTQTWTSREIRSLLDRYLGPRWPRDPSDTSIWDGIERIPAEVLWRAHEVQRQRLVGFVRELVGRQLRAGNATAVEIDAARDILDPNALTIGFARRFAPYKRGNLLLHDEKRLIALLNDRRRPVQLIFAGKSHPQDEAGKRLIQEIVQFSRREEVRGKIIFVEDYDFHVAAHLVAGVDVWLNNPRRPQEASGTSGMKASANGALNCSILDGWWDEAASGGNGWCIGKGEVYDDTVAQDAVESSALYDLLEHEIAPLFYDRGRDGLPRGWIRMMKESMKGLTPIFNTARMVAEYAERAYFPSAERAARLSANDFRGTRELTTWKKRARDLWSGVQIREVQSPEEIEHRVGDEVSVRTCVFLNGLSPDEVSAQIYHGEVDQHGNLVETDVVDMEAVEAGEDGVHWFAGDVPCGRTGHRGFTVRVLPNHPELTTPFLPGMICWTGETTGHKARQPQHA